MDYLLSWISEFSADKQAVRLIFAAVVAVAMMVLTMSVIFLLSATFSRERARALILAGSVLVNGQVVSKARARSDATP